MAKNKKREQPAANATPELDEPDSGEWTSGTEVYIEHMYGILADEETMRFSEEIQAGLRQAVEIADHAYHHLDTDTAMIAMFNAGAAFSRADIFNRFKRHQKHGRARGLANAMPVAQKQLQKAKWKRDVEAMTQKNSQLPYSNASVGRRRLPCQAGRLAGE